MANIVMLFACLAAGVALRRFGRMPQDAHVAFNAFIIHVSLPALILSQIHGLHLNATLLMPIAMPWLLFAISALLFGAFGVACGLPPSTTGALILTAGLANTSFVGLPMIETFYGAHDMRLGILIDQLGTYLVLSTAGIVVACACARGSASAADMARRIVTFPPLIALVLALALLNTSYPAWLSEMFGRLGATLAPLALVSVGLQLRLAELAGNRALVSAGLAFKLVAGPLIIVLLYVGLMRVRGETVQVTIFESAMGPQIGGAIVAVQNGLNPSLVTLMVGIGITLSFLTLPAWWYVLQAV